MGSYNVACSVSRITICPGMRVAYFPLEVSQYTYDPRAENNTLIYPWCYYSPVSLPIFGEYFDYGYIEPIEKNENTQVIEDGLKHSIEEIVGNEGNLPYPGMFVHRDIYEVMVSTQVNEWGDTNPKEHGVLSHDTLNGKYIKLKDALIEIEAADESHKVIYEMSIDRAHFWNTDFLTFTKLYTPSIRMGRLQQELVNFLLFHSSLSYANVHYFPAANGYQFGNHYGNRAVHVKALEILSGVIAQEEDERNE